MMLKRILLPFIGCCLGACSVQETPESPVNPLFRLVPTNESGIDFENRLIETGEENIIEYLYFYNGAGVAAGDLNNDGLVDLYLSSNQESGKLYLNKGAFQFQELTASSGIVIPKGWTTGVAMADVNADGWLDLYVCRVGQYKAWSGHNLLFLNQGDMTFREVSVELGLDFSGFSTQSAFLDYDHDGDLDMYLLNHAVHTTRSYALASKRSSFDSLAGDRFFENKLNEGELRFEEVSEKVGIYSGPQGYGLGVVCSDINQDGHMDIYVANDFHEDDYLYLNTGSGSFVESRKAWINHTSRFSMGVDAADINGDSRVDLFTLDMLPADQAILMKSGGEDENKVVELKLNYGYDAQYSRNALQLNLNNERFADVALLTSTYATDWSWSVLIQDFDLDGKSDLFISNGIYKRPNDLDYINFLSNINLNLFPAEKQDSVEQALIGHMPTLKISNFMYGNEGNLKFTDKASEWGLTEPSYSNGAVYADLDNDGDLDLVVNNLNQPAFVYENRSDTLSNNHFFVLRLSEPVNRYAMGAKVWLWAGGQTYFREVSTTRGFLSSVPSSLHFGLGSQEKVDSLLIQWSDGSYQKVGLQEADRRVSIEKGKTFLKEAAKPKQIESQELPFVHSENIYKDYDREHLIPENLSTEGPALVVADFNGDAQPDLFIGGARGQSPVLFLATANGFQSVESKTWQEAATFEDVDAVAFDMEGDGDLDLYVVSGGNDRADGDQDLMDRLYLNDGKANFRRLEIALPTTNGGCVAVTDFNADNRPDLFVGARSVPGAYGVIPYSYLLQNDGGVRFEVIKRWQAGMITDATWVDLTADTRPDLMLVGDWMPVTIMTNVNGTQLEDQTQEMELAATFGMWNVVETADLNRDGQQDLIVGNLGLNSKLQASLSSPVKLYLDDFDQNGHPDPVIFYPVAGEHIPLASKDDLTKQMPIIKRSFVSYESFAKVRSIQELLGSKLTSGYGEYPLIELRSCVFYRDSTGFRSAPLPLSAQLSTVEALEVVDVDADGWEDLVFVGNFFGYTSTLGRADGNAGGVLLNDRGTFTETAVRFPIRYDLAYRHIEKIGNRKFVVVPNQGSPVIFTLDLP